jgi:hypothetical protein
MAVEWATVPLCTLTPDADSRDGGDRAEWAPNYRAALTVVRMTVWFLPLGRT